MQTKTFEHFLNYFPEVPLPITLSEDLHHTFDKHNIPLPSLLVENYLNVIDSGHIDEFTEYIPCFRLMNDEEFISIVYWKASLLAYEYHIVNFTPKGEIIAHKVIGGLQSGGDGKIRLKVSTIDEDFVISVAEGVKEEREELYDPASTIHYHFEVLDNGIILDSRENKDKIQKK